MSGIGIITNPYSKLNKRNPQLIHLLRQELGTQGTVFVTKSLAELAEIPQQFLKSGCDILAICGGDGTISHTLTSFIQAFGTDRPLPRILLLRGGTMNLVASEVGQKGPPIQILRRFLHSYQDGKAWQTRPLRCLSIQQQYGFLYADGSNVAILEEFYRKKSGFIGACWLACRLVGSFLVKSALVENLVQMKTLQVQINQEKREIFYSLGNLAGTISKIPLGFPLLPFAQDNIDQFQVTLVTCPKEKLLWHLPRIMLQQKKGPGFGKFSTCCHEITIQGPATFSYTLDGEIYQSSSPQLTISCGPVLEFLCN
ncbi:MAG: diacylglycerol/lipid kinase family protein [Oligoflexus sp.]